MNGWTWGCVSALLALACWTDLGRMRIPNGLTFGFAAGGLAYHAVYSGIDGIGWAIAGLLSGFVPLFVMNRLGGIGGGDVKWFAAFGAWSGPSLTIELLTLSILYGGGIACLLLALRLPGIRILGAKLRWPWGEHPIAAARKRIRFPFMLAIAPGFMTLLGKG
ncbi:prepilin peptidase [Paenibacillaceae bacterium WGS1546]|uniref:A24 family peptidase n=1 Tax=Cohnella sp. WGS1546 TaxID=3366810 RepID=UPI00372D4670